MERKWGNGEGEKWRERFTPSPCRLFLTIASPFSHSLAIFSFNFLILSLSFPFSYYLAIFSLPLQFFILSLSIFSFFLYLLSIVSFSLSLSSFSHSFSISSPFSYSLVIFSLFLHFQKCSPVPLHFLIKISNLALLMPNCLNKDVFSVLLFAGRLNLRHLSRASRKS